MINVFAIQEFSSMYDLKEISRINQKIADLKAEASRVEKEHDHAEYLRLHEDIEREMKTRNELAKLARLQKIQERQRDECRIEEEYQVSEVCHIPGFRRGKGGKDIFLNQLSIYAFVIFRLLFFHSLKSIF